MHVGRVLTHERVQRALVHHHVERAVNVLGHGRHVAHRPRHLRPRSRVLDSHLLNHQRGKVQVGDGGVAVIVQVRRQLAVAAPDDEHPRGRATDERRRGPPLDVGFQVAVRAVPFELHAVALQKKALPVLLAPELVVMRR